MATETYRTEKLAEAEANSREARARYDGAKTKNAKREAAEDLEFWSNKVAYLHHARIDQ